MKPFNLTLFLSIAFCLLGAMLFVVGWEGSRHLHQLNRQVQEVVADHWKNEQLTHETFRLSGENSRITLLVFLADDPEEIKQLLVKRAANTDRISTLVRQIEPRLKTEEEKRLMREVLAARTPYVDSYKQALALLLTQNQREEARKMMMNVVRPKLLTYHSAWNAFDQYEINQIDESIQQSQSDYTRNQKNFLLIVGLVGLAAAIVAIFTIMRMSREVAARLYAQKSLREKTASD